jgi:hypothetical protein
MKGRRVVEYSFKEVLSEKYVIYVDANDFFEPLKRTDVFDEFIVLRKGDKQNDSGKTERRYVALYHTFPGHIDIFEPEKPKKSEYSIESGCLKDIEISNKKYKLFFQPIKLNGDNEEKWCIGGLVEDKNIKKETRKLKSGVFTPLLILFSIFILNIPLLKLFLMSKFEQLDIKDVILTYISVIFGVIALFLLYLFIFQVNHDSKRVEENLEVLAEKINEYFIIELNDAYEQLKDYDSKRDSKDFGLKHDCDNIKNILTKPEFEGKCDTPIGFQLEKILEPSIYKLFKGVYWMDSNGQQILQFSTRNDGGSLVNLRHRKYFQDADHWRIPGKPGLKFMLESITSVTSGEKLAAISRRSKGGVELKEGNGNLKATVVAMTSQLISVIDTIMPAGYYFCVIDDTGNVWFHSNTERNLQENFIEEAENDEDLSSAIYSRQAKHLDLDYQNMSHKCFIMPVPDLSLYIITFHDLRYTSATQGSVVLYTVFFTIILSLFHFLLFFITGWSNYRKSCLQRKFDHFEWLRPLKKNEDAYKHIILSNSLIFFYFIVLKIFVFPKWDETLFLYVSVSLFVFIYNYHTITGKEDKKFPLKKHRMLLFFLGFILPINYIAWLVLNPKKFVRLNLFQLSLFLFIGFIALSRYKLSGIYREFIKPRIVNKYIPGFRHFFSRRSYIYFLLSWLVLVWITPVIMFYIDAYNLENEVAIKHLQVKLAERIEERNFRIDTFYENKMDKPVTNKNSEKTIDLIRWTKNKRKESGIYWEIPHPECGYCTKKDFEDATPIDDNKFNKIVCFLKPPMNKIAAERRDFVFPAASDKSRVWQKKNDKIYLQYKIKKSLFNSEDENSLYIVSNLKYFKMPTGLPFLLSVIAISLILTLAYFLMRLFARRIYGLNIPEFENKKQTYIDAQDEIHEAINAGSNLIIYCQTVKEMEYYNEAFCEESASEDVSKENLNDISLSEPIEVYLFNLNSDDQKLEVEKAAKSKSKKVFIKNLELYSNDIDGNNKKMTSVINLLRLPNIQVVITTFKPMTEMIEFYEEKLTEFPPKEKEAKLSTSVEEMKFKIKEIVDLLNEVDNCLVPLYTPLKTIDKEKTKSKKGYPWINKIKNVDIRNLIKNEFKPAEYFEKIDHSVYRYYKNQEKKGIPITEEKIILKIQELAQHYYNKLLDACTSKGKYILYDMAQDMLVNTNNEEAITILLKKGLLVYSGEGGFKLMNESFRNFILTSIDPDYLRHYARTLFPRWKSYKAPLLLIVLGLAVFLAFQEDLLSNVDALITTAIGGIAIITRFSGLFFNFPKGRGK